MNLSRGLFRAWTVLSILWALATISLAVAVVPDSVGSSRYQYVYVMRKDIDPEKVDWNRSLYDLMEAPARARVSPTFKELEWRYVEEWDRNVKDGSMLLFEDAGKLYLNASLKEDDRAHVRKAFSNGRWTRWGRALLPWFGVVLVPPIVLLILGAALVWVIRGFART